MRVSDFAPEKKTTLSARKPWRHHVASCVGAAGRGPKGLVPIVKMSALEISIPINSFQENKTWKNPKILI